MSRRGRVQTLAAEDEGAQETNEGAHKAYMKLRIGAAVSAVPPGFDRMFPSWDGHTKPVPPTREWDAVEAAKAYAVRSAEEIAAARAKARAEGRRQAVAVKEGERREVAEGEAKGKKWGVVKPVNVRVRANIDSARGLGVVPEWYKRELAERKASGADRNAFNLDLGINVRSPHGPLAEKEEAKKEEGSGGGDEEKEGGGDAGVEEEEEDEKQEAKGRVEEAHLAVEGTQQLSGVQQLSAAKGLRKEGLADRLEGEERDVGQTMERIKRLAGGL